MNNHWTRIGLFVLVRAVESVEQCLSLFFFRELYMCTRAGILNNCFLNIVTMDIIHGTVSVRSLFCAVLVQIRPKKKKILHFGIQAPVL